MIVIFSTRVSNALGGGNPQAARGVVFATMFLSIFEAFFMNLVVFSGRNVLGYVFSNEGDVVNYVTEMVPLLCLSIIMDSLHGTLSG